MADPRDLPKACYVIAVEEHDDGLVAYVEEGKHDACAGLARGGRRRLHDQRRLAPLELGQLLRRLLRGRGPWTADEGATRQALRARCRAALSLRRDLEGPEAPGALRELVLAAYAALDEGRFNDAAVLLDAFDLMAATAAGR